MCEIDRRDFIKLGSAGAVTVGLGGVVAGSGRAAGLDADRPIFFHGDGLSLSPREYAAVLADITNARDVEPDNYSNGGVVEDLEHRMAETLGKERAVFMLTGTLANHVAVRLLCEDRAGKSARRVVSFAADVRGRPCSSLVYAAVALHHLDGCEDRFQKAMAVSEDLLRRFEGHPAFKVDRIPNGSNVFWLRVLNEDPGMFQRRMMERGISLREARSDGRFIVQVNETWATTTAENPFTRMQLSVA